MTKKIDVHVHIGNDAYSQYTDEEALRLMGKMGIEYAVISPVPSYPLPYGIKSSMGQNENIASALHHHPDRFVRGLGVVDPRHGKAAVPEVDRIFKELGLHGLMFSCDHTGITMDNPTMVEFMAHAATYPNPVVLSYTSQYSVLEAPYMLRKLAEQFPQISFINGSSMKDTTHSNCSRYLSASVKNVYMDVANIHQLMHPVEWAIRDSGVDKILFGTNIPFCEFSSEIRMIEAADITAEDREMIYWKNAARIFQLS